MPTGAIMTEKILEQIDGIIAHVVDMSMSFDSDVLLASLEELRRNIVTDQQDAQANALMCGICGKKPALVCTECAKDIPRNVRLMQDVDNRAQINYHSVRIG